MAEHLTKTQLFEYLEDALEPEAKQAADAHVAGCAQCQAALEKRRAFTRALGAALSPKPMSDLEMLNKVRAEHARRQEAAERQRGWRTILIGALALAATAAVWAFYVRTPSAQSDRAPKRDEIAQPKQPPSFVGSPGPSHPPPSEDAGADAGR